MAGGKDQLELGAVAMEGLLGEFRAGNIGERGLEKIGLRRHLGELSWRWDERFSGLPAEPFAYSSSKGISRHGRRDAYLKGIIVGLLEGRRGGMIVNPACVWGRHAWDLARRLASFTVIGTDISPRFDRFYNRLSRSRTPSNYEFKKDDIFDPKVQGTPAAVVFFGGGRVAFGCGDGLRDRIALPFAGRQGVLPRDARWHYQLSSSSRTSRTGCLDSRLSYWPNDWPD